MPHPFRSVTLHTGYGLSSHFVVVVAAAAASYSAHSAGMLYVFCVQQERDVLRVWCSVIDFRSSLSLGNQVASNSLHLYRTISEHVQLCVNNMPSLLP